VFVSLNVQQVSSSLTVWYFGKSLEVSVIKCSSTFLPIFVEASGMVIYHSDNVQSNSIPNFFVVEMPMTARGRARYTGKPLLKFLGQNTCGHEIALILVLIVGDCNILPS
jgi:hypothetical protein